MEGSASHVECDGGPAAQDAALRHLAVCGVRLALPEQVPRWLTGHGGSALWLVVADFMFGGCSVFSHDVPNHHHLLSCQRKNCDTSPIRDHRLSLMELSSSIYSDVLNPNAAFVHWEDTLTDTPGGDENELVRSWETSPVNPQSRIDSLTPIEKPTWRLDGVGNDGRQFYAVPTFAIDMPPLRIDVCIPPVEEHPRHLRETLNSDAAIYLSAGNGVIGLPLSQYLLRALDHWSKRLPGFQAQYLSMPFGSQILVTTITSDLNEMEIHLVQRYEVEQAMFGVDALKHMWGDDVCWPESLDWSELRFRRQIHEAITVVRIPSWYGEKDLVFKSLVRDQRYFYNELKTLLKFPSHPSIIRRPLHVVTRRCRFGGKLGVCGFILEYIDAGSLKDRLSVSLPPELGECFRWSRQVTEALIHLNAQPFGFYPDLKLDNVVLREAHMETGVRLDAVLLDLEQRGGWFSWSPPEVLYVEYMEVLALTLGNERATFREDITHKLNEYMPGWSSLARQDKYGNANGGFSSPWLALLRRHQDGRLPGLLEKSQVFMLGKLLWCIFECRPVMRCGIGHELLQDRDPDFVSEPTFPEFRRTPSELQGVIRACTLGAPEWDGRRRGVVLRGGKLVPGPIEGGLGGTRCSTAKATREAVKEWWQSELKRAMAFMEEMSESESRCEHAFTGGVLGQAQMRPTLSEVLADLTRIERSATHRRAEGS